MIFAGQVTVTDVATGVGSGGTSSPRIGAVVVVQVEPETLTYAAAYALLTPAVAELVRSRSS